MVHPFDDGKIPPYIGDTSDSTASCVLQDFAWPFIQVSIGQSTTAQLHAMPSKRNIVHLTDLGSNFPKATRETNRPILCGQTSTHKTVRCRQWIVGRLYGSGGIEYV